MKSCLILRRWVECKGVWHHHTFNVQTSNVLKYENESLRQVPAESKSTLVSRNSPRILQNGRKFFFDVLLSDCKAAGRELDCTGILDPCTVCQRSNASAPRVLAHQPRACVLSPSRPRVHPARDPPCRRAAASPLRPGSTHWQTLDGDADSGARRLGGGVAIAPHAQHAAAPQPRADRPRKRPGPSLRRSPCRPTRGHRRPRQADIQRAQRPRERRRWALIGRRGRRSPDRRARPRSRRLSRT